MPTYSFFTRLLDDAPPGVRLRLATEQIQHAERWGYARAWVAQHHFRAAEGGLPSPFVFLASVAARTERIRLGTGVVTLTIEDPVRAAEDAVVADLLAGGRIDVGLGSGGTPSSFVPFGVDPSRKGEAYAAKIAAFTAALRGDDLGDGNTLYPDAGDLAERIWHATFSVDGGRRAGEAGAGLLLSRTQPRPADSADLPLSDLQQPIVDAYRAALADPSRASVTLSRTVYVADDRDDALRLAETGLRRAARSLWVADGAELPLDELIRRTDTHVGTPDDVVRSLAADATLAEADEVAIQVHSVDAAHPKVLRSLELFATEVAPRLGLDASGPLPVSAATSAHLSEENHD